MSTATRSSGGLVTDAALPHLHHELDAGPDDLVEVTINRAANVQLLDDRNYEDYRAGKTFHYHGGHATHSPVRLQPPRQGHWHIVVDLGGGPGSVRAAVRVIPAGDPGE